MVPSHPAETLCAASQPVRSERLRQTPIASIRGVAVLKASTIVVLLRGCVRRGCSLSLGVLVVRLRVRMVLPVLLVRVLVVREDVLHLGRDASDVAPV